MKNAIKKTVSTLLAVITLSTCAISPATIADAANVSRNTPHIHGQFVYHRYSGEYGPIQHRFYDATGEEHIWHEYYRYDSSYCRVCDGFVSQRKVVTRTPVIK